MAKVQKKHSGYEGLQGKIRAIKLPAIEVWENQYKDKNYTVRLETNEFTCICPKTGLPDFANIIIEYCPKKWCIELKSFKLYLMAFRDIGIFHEHAMNRIFDNFIKSANPARAKIRMEFNLRGGIKTTVEREYSQ